MNYNICIPSYGRADILNTQTLATLKTNNINKQLINVYVANEAEYDIYFNVLDKNNFNELIIGVIGLVEQRQFISDQYPENTNILFLDDDIKSIDLSLSSRYQSLDFFVKSAFEECRATNAFIWGVYPVNNPFFRQNRAEMTTCLNYIVGAFYGVVNRLNLPELELSVSLQFGGQKEDVERTIKYFIKDGVVVRFNRVGFHTKYYNNVGGLGKFKDRLLPMKLASEAILKQYPEYGKIFMRKNGMYEFKLKKLKNNK